MYSRHTTHLQRVRGTSHDTPVPPSRLSALVRPSRAPMRDRTSRVLARQHGRRMRHTAHHRTRLIAYASAAPGLAARLGAQRAHQPRDDRGRFNGHARRPTRATCVALRAARNTACWCGAGMRRSSGGMVPKALPRLGYLRGGWKALRFAAGSAPRWSAWRGGQAGNARREPASRSASEPLRPPHTSGRT